MLNGDVGVVGLHQPGVMLGVALVDAVTDVHAVQAHK
jgi:hypothetical protein